MTQADPKSDSQPPPVSGYQRVDWERVHRDLPDTDAVLLGAASAEVRWGIIPLSALLCGFQAVATILAFHTREMLLTSTLIPVLAFILLFITVLFVNPVLRLVAALVGKWARPLNRVELVCLFTAMLVTSGISAIGLADPLIPMLAAPNNPEWNVPGRGWDEGLISSLNPKLYIQDRNAIKLFRDGVTVNDSRGRHLTWGVNTKTWGQSFSYCWSVFKAIPWMIWLRPLAYWMVFVVACYGIFYCLSYIVLSYWSDKEKLIFPLVRLYESVLPEARLGRYRLPALLLTPGFWCGFSVSFLILGWNANVLNGWMKNSGLPTIPTGMDASAVAAALNGSIFQGIAPGFGVESLCFLFDFIALGVAFFLPVEVSFSIWFYYLIGRLIMLLYIWSGYGENILVFPSDYYNQTNAVTSLGGGGIFVFSAICLFRCIRDYARLVAGKTLGRRLVIALPVVGLVGFSAVAVFWLNWNRLPLGWGVVFVACLTLLTLGLMRVVAESGIYWLQTYTGFYHIYTVLGLGKLLAPIIVAPLLPIYSVLFLDNKTMIAPNLLNAAQMQKNSRADRWKFHINLLLCIILSVAVSLPTSIFLAHMRGGNAMEGFYYSASSAWTLDTARHMIAALPAFNLEQTLWYIAGALWVLLTIVLRTRFFWFPHPIGVVMLMNRMIAYLWFSFFLGWMCKSAAIHYGGKATYDRLRGIFVGMFVGQLAAIVFWTFFALLANVTITVFTLVMW